MKISIHIVNHNYLFNAKELDEESGMYYYSARYYAPPTFISRDPLFEKYFWMSPYAYCNNNPVNLIDPDGEEPEGWIKKSKGGGYIYDSRVNTQADAEKHYGSGAKIAPIGYSYNNSKGERVALHDKGRYTVDGKSHTVKDQAPALSQAWTSVKNVLKKLDDGGHNDGALTGRSSSDLENKITDAMGSGLQGFSLLIPPMGLTNDAMIIFGEDAFGNETSTADKAWAIGGLVTLGMSNVPRNAQRAVHNTGKVVDKVLDVRSVIITTGREYEKKQD